MFKLFTMVRILIDTHCSMDGHTISAGSTGAVVEIYAKGAAYEIETFNPPGLVPVRHCDLMGADVPLTLRTLIDKPTSHYYAARISFAESGFDHRTVKSVLLKLSEWCEARWSSDDWDRTETTFLLRTDAMAFEFKMRWDGADFDSIFG
jgi:hypothetical protein